MMRQAWVDVVLLVLAGLAVAVFGLVALAIGQAAVGPVGGPPTTHDVCFEDEACWNCATMGNQACGVTDLLGP